VRENQQYPIRQDRRPWIVGAEAYEQLERLAPKWLTERGGVVVYENQTLDSSRLGDTSFMPARFVAEEDDQEHDAPMERRPNGGLPSFRQQATDHITIEQYGGDPEKAFKEAFAKEKRG